MRRLVAGVLLAAGVAALTGFAAAQETLMTVGVIAGSYWDAPTGKCYAIIDSVI